jgi:pimeloyl-ACP methyl ester carboxylesterase
VFTPAHRGGAGPPLVLLHGFLDTWRTWELVLPRLERHHDVLAPTLAGHAGGPPIDGPIGPDTLADAVERAMDDAGLGTAHLAGNSLGGYLALQLAARGRARSVVALAPAGGWSYDPGATFDRQREIIAASRSSAPHAAAIAATAEGRRRATALVAEHGEDLPADLVAHAMLGVAACPRAEDLLDAAPTAYGSLDGERITCPVRIVWGTEDRLLPWPAAAARFRAWLPHADWVELEGVGHSPQLDLPLPTAELILGVTQG